MIKLKTFPTCPLCEADTIFYHKENNTHLYICEVCPFIGIEWIDKNNTTDFINYVNRI